MERRGCVCAGACGRSALERQAGVRPEPAPLGPEGEQAPRARQCPARGPGPRFSTIRSRRAVCVLDPGCGRAGPGQPFLLSWSRCVAGSVSPGGERGLRFRGEAPAPISREACRPRSPWTTPTGLARLLPPSTPRAYLTRPLKGPSCFPPLPRLLPTVCSLLQGASVEDLPAGPGGPPRTRPRKVWLWPGPQRPPLGHLA